MRRTNAAFGVMGSVTGGRASRAMMARGFALALGLAASLASVSVSASDQPVARVEVMSKLTNAKDWREVVRASAEQEVARVDWSKVPKRDRVVLSTSLVKLDTNRKGNGVEVSAMVSILIHSSKGGTLHAVVEGRARAEDSARDDAERGAIDAATRGAVRGVPKALVAALK